MRGIAHIAYLGGKLVEARPWLSSLNSLTHHSRWYSSSSGVAPDERTRSAFSYCINQVKSKDYETYLWCTQLPKDLRAPIFALRAFNVETALIEDHAKSEMLVMMRCQWWRDAVNSCYKGKPPDQPVARALAEVLKQYSLTRYRLQRMISAREEDMAAKAPPASLKALEDYAESTTSQLMLLQLEAAGVGGEDAQSAAVSIGKAVGIANILRGTLHHAERGRTYLPVDQCDMLGVDQGDLLRGQPSQQLQEVTRAVAAAAKLHLEEGRGLQGGLPPAARMLLLPAVGAGMFLDALLGRGCNLLDQKILADRAYSPLQYQLKLRWHIFRGTY